MKFLNDGREGARGHVQEAKAFLQLFRLFTLVTLMDRIVPCCPLHNRSELIWVCDIVGDIAGGHHVCGNGVGED